MQDKEKEEGADDAPKAAAGRTVQCRYCKGAHMSFKCPFKDQLEILDKVEGEDDGDAAGGPSKGGFGSATGKYVPPYVRFLPIDKLG
jgi:translation initiation factor 3 subunit G